MRITTLAAMAGLLIFGAVAFLAVAGGDPQFGIARDRSLEPVVPMGALGVAFDATGCDDGQVSIPPQDDCVRYYVPLLGYLFWFGPLGPVILLGVGLVIVYYAGRRVGSHAGAFIGYATLALVLVGVYITFVNLWN